MKSTCPLGIAAATLVALHDNALGSEAATEIREHLRQCPACTDYLDMLATNARSLRGQPVPLVLGSWQRQDRLWRDVRGQIIHGKAKEGSMPISRVNLLRGMGALLGAILLITLCFGAIQLLSRHPLAANAPPRVWHVSTANASTITLPAAFAPSYISPDGASIIGEHQMSAHDPSGNSQAVLYRADMIESYSTATGKLTSLYTVPTDQDSILAVTTDGRYVAWSLGPPVTSNGTYATNTPAPLTLMTMDLQTLHPQLVATKTIQGENINGDYSAALDHGMLFWQDMYGGGITAAAGGMLKMTDLANGATTTLVTTLTVTAISHTDVGFQASWPYVVVTTSLTHEQLINVATGTNVPLPSLPLSQDVDPAAGPQYQLDGATVLASWHTITNGIDFAQIDTTTPNAQWRTIAAVATPFVFPDDYFQANSRLLVFSGVTQPVRNNVVMPATPLAWDRHLHRLLQFPASDATTGVGVELFGKWLVMLQYPIKAASPDQQTFTMNLIDTAQLLVN